MIAKLVGLSAVLVLVVGFLFSAASMGKEEPMAVTGQTHKQAAAMVKMNRMKKSGPLRGGRNKQLKNPDGPWEECMWMSGHECARFIKSQVPSSVAVEFVDETAIDAMISEFDPNRVVILVNNVNNVVEVPARGR